MIDREARNRLLQGIDRLMDEKISPEDLVYLLNNEIVPSTKDTVIYKIGCFLLTWLDGDDIDMFSLQSSCYDWKFFNRLRLLLASDAEYLEVKLRRSFIPFSIVGTIALICGLTYWAFQGFNPFVGILLYFFIGICFSIAIFILTKTPKPKRDPIFAEYPFESFVELLELRRSVPMFQSKRFPNKPLEEKSGHPFIQFLRNNWLIRFLMETHCPAWVDRIGDAFVMFITACLWLVPMWPLMLFSLLLAESSEQKLVIPCTDR